MKTTQINSNEIIDFEFVFKRLNEELSGINRTLELVCAGDYVMQRHGYRATLDVYAFYECDATIEKIIRKVGDDLKINRPDEVWLNNSLSSMNPVPPEKNCEIAYRFSNLSVKTVSIHYLIGMKLECAREQDMIDVGDILRHEKDEQP